MAVGPVQLGFLSSVGLSVPLLVRFRFIYSLFVGRSYIKQKQYLKSYNVDEYRYGWRSKTSFDLDRREDRSEKRILKTIK